VNPMTISTQNFEIPFIVFPVFETKCPIVLAFGRSKFCALVNMINIKNPNIAVPAFSTFSAKLSDKFDFTLPDASLFLKFISLFIPEILLAFWGTKLSLSWLTTIMAFACVPPPSSMVARYAAILHTSLTTIGFAEGHIKFISTMLTGKCYSMFFHSISIPQLPINSKIERKYYDIAEKRIREAQQQPLLFRG
jgi:hypothetical protein